MSDRLLTLNAFLKENPEDTFILFAIAKEHEGLGEIQLALEYYLKLKSIDKEYIGLYYHLGKLYEQLNEGAKAKNTYLDGVTLARSKSDFHAASELTGALDAMEEN